MKNANDTIGNRTRDLPACSAVRQSTAPPRVPGASRAVNEFGHSFNDLNLEPEECSGPSDGVGYVLDSSTFMSWQGQEVSLFSKSSKLAVGLTQTPGLKTTGRLRFSSF